MPDGCNLYETEADYKQILKSLQEGLSADVSAEVVRGKESMIIATASRKLLEILPVSEAIPENYKRKLPDAMVKVIRQTDDTMGILMSAPKHYGKGATGLFDNLRHSTKGDAYAYELLGTAAFIDKEFPADNASDGLKIYPTDRLDFGIKLQASYKGVPSEYLNQPKRGTVEADLFINRNQGTFEPDKIIGVDFKHSRGSTYDNYDMQQLKGIQVALQTAEIHEFCFVSNVRFSQTFKDKIKVINKELLSDWKKEKEEAKSDFGHLFPYFPQEKQKNSEAPQIKIFENVRYRDT